MNNKTNASCEDLEQRLDKKLKQKDKRKKPKMKVGSKSVFGLKRIIESRKQKNKKSS